MGSSIAGPAPASGCGRTGDRQLAQLVTVGQQRLVQLAQTRTRSPTSVDHGPSSNARRAAATAASACSTVASAASSTRSPVAGL